VALATLEDRSHPAWQRLKAEELLAQQLSQLQSKRERARLRAPALTVQRDAANLSLHEQRPRALCDWCRNCRRPGPRRAHAPPAAG
jgi:ATP-dependent DNA helicase RecG